MKPTLYIMCGLPFAGKSTVAKQLAMDLSCVVVEIDAIKTRLGLRDVWQNMTAEDWARIFNESFALVRAELANGRSVIHDSANQTHASRDALRKIAADLDCESSVVFVDVPVEEARARWQENRRTGSRMDLPEWAFEAAVASYGPPDDNEADVTRRNVRPVQEP